MNYEKEFLEGKLAVNCRSKRQAERFEEYCNKNIEKIMNTNIVGMWIYGAVTCYCLDIHMATLIITGKRREYESRGLKVVTYKEFMQSIREEQQHKQKQEQEFTLKEVLILIQPGEEYICTNPTYNIRSIKRDSVSIYFDFYHFNSYEQGRNTAGISDEARFVLKPQHEYMYFGDAIILGRKIKYKDWEEFKTLKETTIYIAGYPQNKAYNMLDEKAWEVEE